MKKGIWTCFCTPAHGAEPPLVPPTYGRVDMVEYELRAATFDYNQTAELPDFAAWGNPILFGTRFALAWVQVFL